jgi:hypothetical protein
MQVKRWGVVAEHSPMMTHRCCQSHHTDLNFRYDAQNY